MKVGVVTRKPAGSVQTPRVSGQHGRQAIVKVVSNASMKAVSMKTMKVLRVQTAAMKVLKATNIVKVQVMKTVKEDDAVVDPPQAELVPMKVGIPVAKAMKSILKRHAAAALAALRRSAAAPGTVSGVSAHPIVSARPEEETMVMRSRVLAAVDALRKSFPSRFVDRSVAVGGPLRMGPDGGKPKAKAGFSANSTSQLCHGCGGVIPWREVVVCRGCHRLFHLWCKVAHLPVCPMTPIRHLPDESLLGQALDRRCEGQDPEDPMRRFSATGYSNEMRKSADECRHSDMGVTPYPWKHTGPSIDFLKKLRLETDTKRRGRWGPDSSLQRYQKVILALRQASMVPTAILQSGKNVEKSPAQYLLGLAASPQPTWNL